MHNLNFWKESTYKNRVMPRLEEQRMEELLNAANRYMETSDWKTIAVLKFCLISLGMMIGMLIKPEHKKSVFLTALGVFIATYIPLMIKFFRVFTEME